MRKKLVMILGLGIISVLVQAQNTERYSNKKLQKLVNFSRTNKAAFLLYDDLGVLLLVKSGQLIDVLKSFPQYKNPAYRVYPALSPDGRKVAFASGMTSLNGKGGAEEIWIFDSSDKSFRKINEVSAVTPEFVVDLPYLMALSWSPDGTRLAVNAGREKLEVWSLENGDHKLVANNIAQDTIPSWSPDGARIAYESVTATGDNRTFHVNVLNLQSEQVKTIADGRFPSWSREANQIAFLDIHQEVYFAVADDGSSRKRLVKAGGQAGPFIWSPDSKAALFDDYYDGGVAVMLVDIGRGKKKALTSGELLAVIDWR